MSEPKRYDVGMTTEFNPHGFNHSFPRVYESEQGRYVEYEDYARLKAEVERLTKAGDAMDSAISEIDPQRSERHRFMKMTDAEYLSVTKWRTAKDPNYNRA